MWLWWAIIACGPALPSVGDSAEPVVVPASPSLASFDLSCDADVGVWTLQATTDAWSGGAVSHWSVDGAYVETHRPIALSYAEDGSSETLELVLAMVSDWREQSSGASTAFTCAAGPQVLFVLNDLGGVAADCLVVGEPAFFDDVGDTPDCAEAWDGAP